MRQHPLYQRITLSKRLAIELVIASVFINILALASPVFTIQVLTRFIANGVTGTLITLLVGVIIAIIMEFLFRLLRYRLATAVCLFADQQLQHNVFSALNRMRFSALNRIPISKRQQLISSTHLIQQAYSSANISTILDLPFSLLFILFVALLSPWIAFTTCLIAVVVWLVGRLNVQPIKKATDSYNVSKLKLSTLVNASLGSAATLRSFNALPLVQNVWKQTYTSVHSVTSWLENRKGIIQSFTQNATTINTVLVFTIGAIEVVRGELNIGMLIGANILTARALMPIVRISNLTEQLSKAKLAENQIAELSKFPSENYSGTKPTTMNGHIELKDFAFAYPGSKVALYEHFNICINPGDTACVSGKNGTGKTTLSQLLVGLLEPSRGQLFMDHIDAQQLSVDWLRQHISYLPQKIDLFPGTLLENIILGKKDVKKSELDCILKRADLNRFINQLPKGIHTTMIDAGNQLAVGIHKRIAMARALTSNGQICLFDDPLETLDSDGKDAMLSIIKQLQHQKRTLIILGNDEELIQLANIKVDLNEKPRPNITQ